MFEISPFIHMTYKPVVLTLVDTGSGAGKYTGKIARYVRQLAIRRAPVGGPRPDHVPGHLSRSHDPIYGGKRGMILTLHIENSAEYANYVHAGTQMVAPIRAKGTYMTVWTSSAKRRLASPKKWGWNRRWPADRTLATSWGWQVMFRRKVAGQESQPWLEDAGDEVFGISGLL